MDCKWILRNAYYDLSFFSSFCKVLENEEFADFVVEDARSVQNREVTDTVPIIDEIRYHITCYIQTYSEVYEANRKLALIDHFLVLLQINA